MGLRPASGRGRAYESAASAGWPAGAGDVGDRRNGGVWLMVMLPDGFPAPVRVGDTELGGPGVAATGTTILSVAGIRRLRELAAGVAAKDRDQ